MKKWFQKYAKSFHCLIFYFSFSFPFSWFKLPKAFFQGLGRFLFSAEKKRNIMLYCRNTCKHKTLSINCFFRNVATQLSLSHQIVRNWEDFFQEFCLFLHFPMFCLVYLSRFENENQENIQISHIIEIGREKMWCGVVATAHSLH